MALATCVRALFLAGLMLAAHAAAAKPPEWLVKLAAKPPAMEYGDADDVVLLDEGVFTVDKDGVVTCRTRYAIRVLRREGRSAASARVGYLSSSEKVDAFQAWLIPPSGAPIDYGRRQIVDTEVYATARELYGEARQKFIFAAEDATPGAVFGYEAVTIERSAYAQKQWWFQQKVPVESSSITLVLPPGWRVQSHTFNHAPIEPVVAGPRQTWELRALPAIKDEPLGPSLDAIKPSLALDLQPPAGAKTMQRLVFASWAEVSAYFSPYYASAATVDATTKARAEQLVAGAPSGWERVARICRFAQAVNYISISLNGGQGGGMIPRPANRVLQCNYGDCKDKATLLASLLRAAGIESWPLVVFSGDATHVRPEWASPTQFNHCILAIKLDEARDLPGVLNHPTLGRLLIFDPTNEDTPAGWLPEEDLGGLGLLLDGERGELLRLPVGRMEDSRLERTVTARLEADGAVTGTVREQFAGNSSAEARSEHRSVSETDYRSRIIERWLSRSLPSVHVARVAAEDDFAAAKFSLATDFSSIGYGRHMRDTLLVFKPALIPSHEPVVLKKGKRTQPVVIRPEWFTEHTEFELPDGFNVDELSPATDMKSPFGHYKQSAEVRDGRLHLERSLELTAATLPPEDYDVARGFFEKMLAAERAPVVLKQK